MEMPTHAPELLLGLSDYDLIAVEYDLPQPAGDGDLEEQADLERQRYDEQILAALVAP